jgi:MFS family permease
VVLTTPRKEEIPMVTSHRLEWFALALLTALQFMLVLNVVIVNVALPSIQEDLGFSQGNLQWVISAYALVFGGFLLLGGRLADILGRRGVFIGGLAKLLAARRGDPVRIEGVIDPAYPESHLFVTDALLPGPRATLVGPTFEQWLDSTA